ncbi:hypothetical protein [Streptomyces angustmyceticus]|uniref:hypothetical protein n=1 Tax=Streptomyces angustmyceticus TaxID=285578 RepID=UPI0021AF3743|nr:hypothetical protein [Streptomyces angustmyceticus]
MLTGAVKAILPLDRLPDQISPQNAIDVVEVRDVKTNGRYLVRGDTNGHFATVLNAGKEWRHRADIIDVNDAEWMITLQGRAAQQVRITDIVPQLEGGKCSSPPGGDLVDAPGQGVTDVVPLEVAIDSPQPTMTSYAKGRKSGEPYFTGPKAKQITLNQNESQAFLIHATSGRGHCRWRYRVHYQVGGGTAEMTLSRAGGKPFELTGELPGIGRYRSVHFPSFTCAGTGSYAPGKWFTQTGAEYARAQRRRNPSPCPQG